MFRITTTSALALLSAGAAHAGGWVAPVIPVAAPPVVAAPAGPEWWLALIPLAILAGLTRGGGGGDRATLPPGDHGGPCFREGTLISTEAGWRPVETLAAGDLVTTSKGAQPILSVESWQPVEFRDRPVVFVGVSLSQNHCVDVGGRRVPANMASPRRGIIDGARYYHVMVQNHAWLTVKGLTDGPELRAESMGLTDDIQPLAARFPALARHHAAWPCDLPELVGA